MVVINSQSELSNIMRTKQRKKDLAFEGGLHSNTLNYKELLKDSNHKKQKKLGSFIEFF